jgi:WD40 repeat protein
MDYDLESNEKSRIPELAQIESENNFAEFSNTTAASTHKLKELTKVVDVNSFVNAVLVLHHSSIPRCLCASADSTVRLINALTGHVDQIYEGHTDRVLSLAISPLESGPNARPQIIVSGSRDENVCVWFLETAEPIHVLSGHEGPVWAVGVYLGISGESEQHARSRILSGSSDATIRSWDLTSGTPIHLFKGHTDNVLCLFVMVDKDRGGGREGATPSDQASSLVASGPNGIKCFPKVISGGSDKAIRVWDMLTGRHSRMLEGHTDEVTSVSVVEDSTGQVFVGARIISASRDNSIRVWDLAKGHQLKVFVGHTDCVYAVCAVVGVFGSSVGSSAVEKSVAKTVGPNGRSCLIISSAEDRSVRVWNMEDEKQILCHNNFGGSIKSVSVDFVKVPAVSPSNPPGAIALMATCGWDKTVQFYDLEKLTIESHRSKCCVVS